MASNKTHIPTTLSRVLVCIDSVLDSELAGRIYTAMFQPSMVFQNLSEFHQAMDLFFDEFRFPQPTHQYRSFYKNGSERTKESMNQPTKEDMKLPNEAGEAGTFIVHVKFRQNASWQGSVQWVEGKRTQNFRSTLELMKLMDEALHKEEDPPLTKWE